jgi:hypothetical protein
VGVAVCSGAVLHAFAVTAEQAEYLCGLIAGAAEPVRFLGVELGDLTRSEDEVVSGENESHLAGDDVEPGLGTPRSNSGGAAQFLRGPGFV